MYGRSRADTQPPRTRNAITAAIQMINTRNSPGIHRAAENIAETASQPASGMVPTSSNRSQSALMIAPSAADLGGDEADQSNDGHDEDRTDPHTRLEDVANQ